MQKFEKLLKKGKLDKNEIYKEINLLKGEKVNSVSIPISTDYIKSNSILSEDDKVNEYFKTEQSRSNDYMNTETDYKGVSTFASYES